uniref:Alpha-tocopherol transfer protein n=1 Tax=Cacopsylla melanoneura TaxID=428564 RepID=A0A8D8W8A6_9HEMI
MSTEVSQELLQTAWQVSLEDELAKEPNIKKEDIAAVVDWCREQMYLPPVSEHTAALFLKLSGYDVEKAQGYIDNHYTFRTYYRNIFADRDPELKEVKQAMNAIHMFILPGYVPNKGRILFGSLKTDESSKFNASQGLKYVYMTMEKDVLEHGIADTDFYSILFDAKGFGLGHLTTISISFIKQLFSYFLDGCNMTTREIEIINVNQVVEKLVSMIKTLTPKDVHEKIKLYTKDKTEAVLAKYPPEILPKELRGQHPMSLAEMSESNEKAVSEFRAWYLADEKYLRVDESKRPVHRQNKKVVKIQTELKKLELD